MDWFSPTANCPRCDALLCVGCRRDDMFSRMCGVCNAVGCVFCAGGTCTHNKPI
jgi:hypothetical protein